MKENENIEILIVSEIDEYEDLLAEIKIDDRYVARINQEKGPEELEIEFQGAVEDEDLMMRKIKLSVFLEAIEIARARLLEFGPRR